MAPRRQARPRSGRARPPIRITRLRPSASDSGPTTSVPSPMPRTKLVRISCARLASWGDSSAAISGSAGSIASMEKATVAKIVPISAMNSVRDRRFFLPARRSLRRRSLARHPSRRGPRSNSSTTCIQNSGDWAPVTTCCRDTTKQGTPVTPRDRAEASRARRSSASASPARSVAITAPPSSPMASAISRSVSGSPISRPSTK